MNSLPPGKAFDGPEIFRVQSIVASYLPDEYKAHSLKRCREQAAGRLFDALYRYKSPCVVWVDEYIEPINESQDEIRIEIRMNSVTTMHVAVLGYIPPVVVKPPRGMTFFERLRFLFRGE